MKLLLTSAGLTNTKIVEALEGLAQKKVSDIKLVFVPTAAMIEVGDKSELVGDFNNCKNLGFKSFDLVDIASLSKDNWMGRLFNSDVILFGGGNTFYLMDQINKTGLREKLSEILKERVYVGISAGSIVVCPDVEIAGWDPTWDKNIVNLSDTKGLGLVSFLVSPHFVENDRSLLLQKQKELGLDIYALTDNQALLVDETNMEVVGEGEELFFGDNREVAI